MADEQRATLAILGAGPVGLEAALVAARLKIDFIWLERGQAGEHLNRWGHLQTHAPLRTLVSEIGLEELHKAGVEEFILDDDSYAVFPYCDLEEDYYHECN